MTRIINEVGLFMLLLAGLVTGTTLKDEPQLRSNATLKLAGTGSLDTRDLFGLVDRASSYYTCNPGYSECSYDSSRCCPTGNSCCGNGYCADPGDTCCTMGTCPSGWNCCGNDGTCSPKGGECCSGGYYCQAGMQCRVWRGEKVCCPSSGCVGENDSGNLGNTVTAGPSVTETATMLTTAAPSLTTSYNYLDYEYYYTTIYWTYWFYYWTSYSPYTAKTVTSTQTTTTTIWSVYQTDSAEASASLAASAESYTFSTPYSATYLKTSDPVTLVSDSFPTPTSTSFSSGGGNGVTQEGSTSGVSANGFVALAGASLAALIGAVAFAL